MKFGLSYIDTILYFVIDLNIAVHAHDDSGTAMLGICLAITNHENHDATDDLWSSVASLSKYTNVILLSTLE